MDLDNAAAFMLGTIGYGVGFLVIIVVAVATNNVISKYWKPVRIFTTDSWMVFSSTATDNYVNNHPEVIAARKKEQQLPKEPT